MQNDEASSSRQVAFSPYMMPSTKHTPTISVHSRTLITRSQDHWETQTMKDHNLVSFACGFGHKTKPILRKKHKASARTRHSLRC